MLKKMHEPEILYMLTVFFIFLSCIFSSRACDIQQTKTNLVICTPGDKVTIRDSIHLYDNSLLNTDLPEKTLQNLLHSNGLKKKHVKPVMPKILALLREYYLQTPNSSFDHNLHISIKKNATGEGAYSLLVAAYRGYKIVCMDIEGSKIIKSQAFFWPSPVKNVSWCTNKFFYVQSFINVADLRLCRLNLFDIHTFSTIYLNFGIPIRDSIPHPTDSKLCYIQKFSSPQGGPMWYEVNIVKKTSKLISGTELENGILKLPCSTPSVSRILSDYESPVIKQTMQVALAQQLHLPIGYLIDCVEQLKTQKMILVNKLTTNSQKKKYRKQLGALLVKEHFFIEDSLRGFAKNKKS